MTQLARRLGLLDAVVIGLGSMIGAGVFSVWAPAAGAAGGGLFVGLVLAAFVAYCNATSSVQLAAKHPASGGTYVYGRAELNDWWGCLAGWGFVIGKTASAAAMALVVASYLLPEGWWQRPFAALSPSGHASGRPARWPGSQTASQSEISWATLSERSGTRSGSR